MALYDSIGCTYDVTRTADPFIVSRLLHHLKPSPTRLYLDVGCGSGRLGQSLKARQDAQVVGIELDEQAAEAAAQRLVPCAGAKRSKISVSFGHSSMLTDTNMFTCGRTEVRPSLKTLWQVRSLVMVGIAKTPVVSSTARTRVPAEPAMCIVLLR